MTQMIVLYLLIIAVLACATTSIIWLRRDTAIRAIAVISFVASLPLLMFGMFNALGFAKPTDLELLLSNQERYEVVGSMLVPDRAIYVMLDVGGEPRLYELPWNAVMANVIQDARYTDNKLLMRGVFRSWWPEGDDHTQDTPIGFYALPASPSPDKHEAVAPPQL